MVTGSAKRALGRPGRGTPSRRRRCYARRPRGARVVGRCPSSISFPNPRVRTQRCAPGTPGRPQHAQCPHGSRADRTGRARVARVARRQTGPRNERRRDARLRLSTHAARRASLYKRRPQRCDFSKIFECVFLRATFANECLGVHASSVRPGSPRHWHHRAGSMVPCGMRDRLTFDKSL